MVFMHMDVPGEFPFQLSLFATRNIDRSRTVKFFFHGIQATWFIKENSSMVELENDSKAIVYQGCYKKTMWVEHMIVEQYLQRIANFLKSHSKIRYNLSTPSA